MFLENLYFRCEEIIYIFKNKKVILYIGKCYRENIVCIGRSLGLGWLVWIGWFRRVFLEVILEMRC